MSAIMQNQRFINNYPVNLLCFIFSKLTYAVSISAPDSVTSKVGSH